MTSPAGSNVPIPYVAPWVANWNRYSTQTFAFKAAATGQVKLTVPTGQWWRVVYITTEFDSDATVGDRISAVIFAPGSIAAATIAAPAVTTASVTCNCIFAVGLSAYAPPTVGPIQLQTVGLVDLLWPQSTAITFEVNFKGLNDRFGPCAAAVEVYTESVDVDTGVPVLIPSPVLT